MPRALGLDLAQQATRPLQLGEQDLIVVVSHDCDIASIYLAIDDIELDETHDYLIVLRGVMLVRDYDVETRRARAQVTLGRIAGALSACEGIHVVDEELLSERDVSLDDIRVMKRWSPFDTLSLTEDDN